jgi:hypothetical protein
VVDVHVHRSDSYISSGIAIAEELKLTSTTNVILEFIPSNSSFKLHLVNDQQNSGLKTIDEYDGIKTELTDEEINSINRIDFNTQAVYTYTKKISPCVARVTNPAILVSNRVNHNFLLLYHYCNTH